MFCCNSWNLCAFVIPLWHRPCQPSLFQRLYRACKLWRRLQLLSLLYLFIHLLAVHNLVCDQGSCNDYLTDLYCSQHRSLQLVGSDEVKIIIATRSSMISHGFSREWGMYVWKEQSERGERSLRASR